MTEVILTGFPIPAKHGRIGKVVFTVEAVFTVDARFTVKAVYPNLLPPERERGGVKFAGREPESVHGCV